MSKNEIKLSVMQKLSDNEKDRSKTRSRVLLISVIAAVIMIAALFLFKNSTKNNNSGDTEQTPITLDPKSLIVTEIDKENILQEMGISQVGSHYIATGCKDHLQVEFIPIDLNGDNRAEVILRVTGSPCFSGMMQSNVSVFVKSQGGRWRDSLGFLPAFGVRIQEAKTKGYSDIVLTVMGGCDPLYRWTGGSYFHADVVPTEGANCGKGRD